MQLIIVSLKCINCYRIMRKIALISEIYNIREKVDNSGTLNAYYSLFWLDIE